MVVGVSGGARGAGGRGWDPGRPPAPPGGVPRPRPTGGRRGGAGRGAPAQPRPALLRPGPCAPCGTRCAWKGGRERTVGAARQVGGPGPAGTGTGPGLGQRPELSPSAQPGEAAPDAKLWPSPLEFRFLPVSGRPSGACLALGAEQWVLGTGEQARV